MVSHALARILDLIRDPRVPHNILETFLRTRKLTRIMKAGPSRRELCVALTFDVEREYGSRRVNGNPVSVRQFLSKLEDFSSKTTVFIEGSLVEENSKVLRLLEAHGTEIGLHGYLHELWGPTQWYLSDKPISAQEKAALLQKCKEIFERSGLQLPVSFRAPNLVSDAQTVQLLVQYGFRIDSSLPSQLGVLPVPQLFGEGGGLVRIPVSADPRPLLSWAFLIPHFTFRACNLKTLTNITNQEFVEFASSIASIQDALGFRPHLVVLSHSWEFFDPLTGGGQYGYCSPGNFEILRNFLNALSDNFDVKQMSMNGLAREITHSSDYG